MGYNTIINKQFIKVDDKRFIPYVNSKSSNCTMINSNGREVRAEEMFPCVIGRKTDGSGRNFTTIEAVTKYLDNAIAERVENGHFDGTTLTTEQVTNEIGWWLTFYVGSNRSMSKSQIINWYTNGFKSALTIEEIIAEGGTIKAINYDTRDEIKFETSNDLIKFIDSDQETQYQISFISYEFVRRSINHKKKADRLENPKREVIKGKQGYVVTFIENEELYIQQSKRKRYYTAYISETKVFKTEKAALRQLKKLNIYGTKVVLKTFEEERELTY